MLFFGLFEVPLYFILLICFVVLLYTYGTHYQKVWNKLGVPGPPPTAFIGHMDRLYDPNTGFRHNIRLWCQRYGKIFGILFFRDPCLCVADEDALKDIFVKDFNNYVDRYMVAYDALWQPITRKGLFFNTGQDWKRIRKIMSPCFTSGKLKFLTHRINMTSSQLVKALQKHVEDGTQPEAKVVFSAYSLDALASSAFGLDLDSQNNINGSFYQHAKLMVDFRPTLKLVLGTVGVFPFTGFIFKMLNIRFLNANAIDYFKEQLTKLVMLRKEDPDQFQEGDFLQLLMKAEADSSDEISGNRKLTTEEIVAQCIIFVLAGYETTSATLQWLAYELAKNKNVQKRLRKEIDVVVGDEKEVTSEHCQKLKYMEAVITEGLRMYPPVVSLTRVAEKATTLKGFSVPAGTAILIPVANICRDPDIFEDPDMFNPDRFLEGNKTASSLIEYVPFGFGPRQCIGMRLAQLQLKIALVHLMRMFSVEETLPKNVGIDDFTGLLLPKEPIRLVLKNINMRSELD